MPARQDPRAPADACDTGLRRQVRRRLSDDAELTATGVGPAAVPLAGNGQTGCASTTRILSSPPAHRCTPALEVVTSTVSALSTGDGCPVRSGAPGRPHRDRPSAQERRRAHRAGRASGVRLTTGGGRPVRGRRTPGPRPRPAHPPPPVHHPRPDRPPPVPPRPARRRHGPPVPVISSTPCAGGSARPRTRPGPEGRAPGSGPVLHRGRRCRPRSVVRGAAGSSGSTRRNVTITRVRPPARSRTAGPGTPALAGPADGGRPPPEHEHLHRPSPQPLPDALPGPGPTLNSRTCHALEAPGPGPVRRHRRPLSGRRRGGHLLSDTHAVLHDPRA